MKTKIVFLMLVISSIVVTGCKKEETATTVEEKTTFDLAAAKTAIQARSKVFADAINSKDSVGLGNCYTVDAKLMQPNGESVMGKDHIQELFGQWMKTDMPTFSIETVEVWGNETTLTAEENWTFTDKDGKVVDQGKALELYKMEDGVWKLHRDCYNSNMPLPKK